MMHIRQEIIRIALAEPELLAAGNVNEFDFEPPTLPDLPWHKGPGLLYTTSRVEAERHWLEYRAAYLFGCALSMYYSIDPLVAACELLATGLEQAAGLQPHSVHTQASVHETRLLHDELCQLMRASLRETSPSWGMTHTADKIEEAATAISACLTRAASRAWELVIREKNRTWP